MSCDRGRRRSSDPALLWLWYRSAAIAPIRPLAWEPPYAVGMALISKKKKKKKVHTLILNFDLHHCVAPHEVTGNCSSLVRIA